jgi:hypothetical protein
MGVKGFWTATIFWISPRCLLLLHHDIYDFTAMPSFVAPRYFVFAAMPSFCCATIFMISPRCPSFVAPRYFCLHRDALLSALHDTFKFARTPFAKILIGIDLERAQSFDPRFSRPPYHPVRPDFPGTVGSHGFLHRAAFPTPSKLKCSFTYAPVVAGLPDRFRHVLSFRDRHVPMRACRHVPRVPSHFWGVIPQVVAFTTAT